MSGYSSLNQSSFDGTPQDYFAQHQENLSSQNNQATQAIHKELDGELDQKISITSKAHIKASALLTDKEALCVLVEGGGCAGFSVRFCKVSIEEYTAKNYHNLNFDGVNIVINQDVRVLIGVATIDYVESVAGSYFSLISQNASKSCGCGISIGF